MKYGLLILSVLIGTWASAQTRFSEGTITYTVETWAGETRDEVTLSGVCLFKGAHYRSDLSSSRGSSTTLFDAREGNGAVFHDFGTQKILININREQWNDRNSTFRGDLKFVQTGDTATILGSSCRMATLLLADSSKLAVWYTPDLIPENTDVEWQFQQINGLVLSISMEKEGVTVMFKATALSFDPVPIQKFDIPTGGYRVLDYWESKKW